MAAAQNEQLLDPSYDNYVVFISDGWQYCSIDNAAGAPSCAAPTDCAAMGVEACQSCNACQQNDSSAACQGQNADGCYCVRNWPVLGVQALADAGVKTYVVGFGDNVDATTLNQAAQVGGDTLPDCDPNSDEASCYLKASSPSELTSVLDKVMLRLTRAPCEGGCGIQGKRRCTLQGWSECLAPEEVACSTTCGTEGTQMCVDGNLGYHTGSSYAQPQVPARLDDYLSADPSLPRQELEQRLLQEVVPVAGEESRLGAGILPDWNTP